MLLPRDRPVDLVANSKGGQRSRSAVAKQNWRITKGTVGAGMTASPVRVDGPLEWEEVAGDVVDDGLGLDLDELDAAELGRVERPAGHLEQLLAFHEGTYTRTPVRFRASTTAARAYAQTRRDPSASHFTRRTMVPGRRGVPSRRVTSSMTAVISRIPRPLGPF